MEEVTVTAFINPHLFWIFQKKHVEQRNILDNNLESETHQKLESADVGQHVLVFNDKIWRRGIVKFKEPTYYLCWLVDYGTFFETSELYKQPENYVAKPALAQQAALIDIVYLKREYTFGGLLEEKELLVFSEGVVKCAIEYIRSSREIYFEDVYKTNDILLGDVYMKNVKGKQSLIEELIEDKLVVKNRELFKIAFAKNSVITTDILLTYKHLNSRLCMLPQSHAAKLGLAPTVTKGIGRGISQTSRGKYLIQRGTLSLKEDLQSNVEKYKLDTNSIDDRIQPSTSCTSDRTEQNLTDNSSTTKISLLKGFKQKPIPNMVAAGMESSLCDQSSKIDRSANDQLDNKRTRLDDTEDKNRPSSVQTVTPYGLKFSFGCKCAECECWNFEDVEYIEKNQFKDSKIKMIKNIRKPSRLFKAEDETSDDDIQTVLYVNSDSKVQRCILPRILVHGQILPTPVMSIQDVSFHSYVRQAMRPFEQVFTIQNFGWPAIMRNMNTCLVGKANSGKTMAYLPAICTILLERNVQYKYLPTKGVGPVVLILCPGAKVAENVHKTVVNLMEPIPKKIKIALVVQMLDKKCIAQFENQCDLLITTPPALLRLLKMRVITLKLLCNLVLESATVLVERFQAEMDTLFCLMESMLSHRKCNYSVQIITVSEQWTHPLEKLVRNLNFTPIVCITSYLEAALYGRARLQLHFLESQMKAVKLAGLLKNKANVCRTIVVCNTEKEMKTINEYLMYSGIGTLPIHDTMDKNEVLEMESKWLYSKKGKHLVLICTDNWYAHSIDIRNANILVNYSLPDYWSAFTNRFTCLLDTYASPLTTKTPNGWMECVVHIFIDEFNTKQYPRLYRLLKRSNVSLSENFENCHKKCIDDVENVKIESKIDICYNVKMFGSCSLVACQYRHKLSPTLDYVGDLPENGTVRFKILNIINPITFHVKLFEHIDMDGKRRSLDVHENIQEKLQESMNLKRICVFKVEVDKLYVYYFEKEKLYKRCAVLEIVLCNQITKAALSVSVRFIDTGNTMTVSTLQLYELPNEFRSIRPQATKVIIANYVPSDSDDDWCSNAIVKLEYLLNSTKFDSTITYATGKILLRLENTLWLRNVLVKEDLKMMNVTVTRFDVKRSLQQNNLISSLEEQLASLYKLCAEANIVLPKYVVDVAAKKTVEQSVQTRWAYLEDVKYQEIYITCLVSPSQVFVRLTKYHDLLTNLERDIQQVITKVFYPKDFEVTVGNYYLAKDPCTDNFCRVKAITIEGNDVTVFYVDYGDYATVKSDNLKFLTDELISKLPFQAIECRLYGVSPFWGGWSESAINKLDNYIFEPDTDYFRTLHVKVFKHEMSAVTGGTKYAIMLVDNFVQELVVINRLLIECELAEEVDDEDLCMEISLPKQQVEEIEFDCCDLPDDKDYTIEEINDYRKKHAMADNDNVKIIDTSETMAAHTEEEESVWDIEIMDMELFMKQLLGLKETPSTITIDDPDMGLCPITAAAPIDYCLPNVTWYQTEIQVKLHILLTDVVDYSLRLVRGYLLTFSTINNCKQYKLSLKLRHKVQKTFEHTVMGQYIKVTLTKCVPQEWAQLTFDNKRLWNVKYDVSKIALPKDKKKLFLDLEDDYKEKVENCVEYEFGSDEDSESDIENTWSD